MTTPTPHGAIRYVAPDGRLTQEGLLLLAELARQIADLTTRVEALESP